MDSTLSKLLRKEKVIGEIAQTQGTFQNWSDSMLPKEIKICPELTENDVKIIFSHAIRFLKEPHMSSFASKIIGSLSSSFSLGGMSIANIVTSMEDHPVASTSEGFVRDVSNLTSRTMRTVDSPDGATLNSQYDDDAAKETDEIVQEVRSGSTEFIFFWCCCATRSPYKSPTHMTNLLNTKVPLVASSMLGITEIPKLEIEEQQAFNMKASLPPGSPYVIAPTMAYVILLDNPEMNPMLLPCLKFAVGLTMTFAGMTMISLFIRACSTCNMSPQKLLERLAWGMYGKSLEALVTYWEAYVSNSKTSRWYQFARLFVPTCLEHLGVTQNALLTTTFMSCISDKSTAGNSDSVHNLVIRGVEDWQKKDAEKIGNYIRWIAVKDSEKSDEVKKALSKDYDLEEEDEYEGGYEEEEVSSADEDNTQQFYSEYSSDHDPGATYETPRDSYESKSREHPSSQMRREAPSRKTLADALYEEMCKTLG